MQYDIAEIKRLPDILSLADLCRVCHLSKLDARYYLKSGLIPCETTGKKTRCYLIQKTALLKALKDYSKNPKKYTIPRIWREKGEVYYIAVHGVTYLPPQDIASNEAIEYYRNKLADASDIIGVADIMRITGYSQPTITRWCKTNKLISHAKTSRLWIPKKELLRFLTSFAYNDIHIKSPEHLADLKAIYSKIHQMKESI